MDCAGTAKAATWSLGGVQAMIGCVKPLFCDGRATEATSTFEFHGICLGF